MCGWACPLGAFQEMKDRMVPKHLRPHRSLPLIRYVLIVGWLGALIALAAVGGGISRIDLLYLTESGVSIDNAMGWVAYAVIAGIVLLPAFFAASRAFCRYLCPWVFSIRPASSSRHGFTCHLSTSVRIPPCATVAGCARRTAR